MKKTGVVAQVVGEPTVFDIVFTDKPVIDYRAVMTADGAKLRRFNEVCLRNGVLKGGSKIYVSIVHDEADVERDAGACSRARWRPPRDADRRRGRRHAPRSRRFFKFSARSKASRIWLSAVSRAPSEPRTASRSHGSQSRLRVSILR